MADEEQDEIAVGGTASVPVVRPVGFVYLRPDTVMATLTPQRETDLSFLMIQTRLTAQQFTVSSRNDHQTEMMLTGAKTEPVTVEMAAARFSVSGALDIIEVIATHLVKNDLATLDDVNARLAAAMAKQ